MGVTNAVTVPNKIITIKIKLYIRGEYAKKQKIPIKITKKPIVICSFVNGLPCRGIYILLSVNSKTKNIYPTIHHFLSLKFPKARFI